MMRKMIRSLSEVASLVLVRPACFWKEAAAEELVEVWDSLQQETMLRLPLDPRTFLLLFLSSNHSLSPFLSSASFESACRRH